MALTVRLLIRKVLLVGLLASVGYMGWLLSRVDKPAAVEVREQVADPAQMPATPQEEMGCFDDLVVDWAGDRLEASRACKRPDGWSELQRVTLRSRHADGKDKMTLRADRGRTSDARPDQPMELTGNVHVETPEGLKLDGDMLLYDKRLEQVRSERKVVFSQGDLSGEAGRMVYDMNNGLTRLEDGPLLRLSGASVAGRLITLVGVAIDHDDRARILVARGAALLEFADGSIEAQEIEIHLVKDRDEVETITATGGAATRTVMTGGAAGGAPGPAVARVLRATRIVHRFLAAGALDAIEADGGARLEGSSVDPAAGITELLQGDRLQLDFQGTKELSLAGLAAQGTPARFSRRDPAAQREVEGSDLALTTQDGSFRRLVVKGGADVKDEMPALSRTLKADDADLSFAPGGVSLDALAFTGAPGRLEEIVRASGLRRTVVALRGDLRFDATGRPVGGSLDGRVELLLGDTRASADAARLHDAPRRTVLTGNAAVEREGRTSHGNEITIEEERQVMVVRGNQHTLVRDSSGIPGMASQESDEPILISSDDLELNEREQVADYRGGRPSLRRGDTELLADRLLLADREGTLDATGGVTSRLRLARPGEGVAASNAPFDPTRLVDGRADSFHYRRAERRVTYLGSVALEQEDTLLTADRVDILLTATEPIEVERLEASGTVFFRAPRHGEAEGERLAWRASDGSFRVYEGDRPARAVDAEGNFQTGAIVEMTSAGVRALASPAGRARGSSPALQVPVP